MSVLCQKLSNSLCNRKSNNIEQYYGYTFNLIYLGVLWKRVVTVIWKWFFFWQMNESSNSENLNPLSVSTWKSTWGLKKQNYDIISYIDKQCIKNWITSSLTCPVVLHHIAHAILPPWVLATWAVAGEKWACVLVVVTSHDWVVRSHDQIRWWGPLTNLLCSHQQHIAPQLVHVWDGGLVETDCSHFDTQNQLWIKDNIIWSYKVVLYRGIQSHTAKGLAIASPLGQILHISWELWPGVGEGGSI